VTGTYAGATGELMGLGALPRRF